MKFTKEELCAAIRVILKNASELMEDAKLLKKHGRFARSYSLYHLAMEEAAKADMTFFFMVSENIGDEEAQKNSLKE